MSLMPMRQLLKRSMTGETWRQRVSTLQQERNADQAHRETDPVERAKAHLQRRGFVVFAAHVVGKGKGWVVGRGDPIDDAALIAWARRKGLPA